MRLIAFALFLWEHGSFIRAVRDARDVADCWKWEKRANG